MSSQGLFQFLDPLQNPQWDEMVMANPGCTFFHSAAWARVLKSTYDYVPQYLCKKIRSDLSAVLPVMEVNSRWTGCRGISLPFTDECPPLLSEGMDFSAIFPEILEHGRCRRWKYFEARGGKNNFQSAKPAISFYRHTIDLTKGSDELFNGFDSAVRRAIRKAESSGIKVEQGRTLDAIRIFYSLHEQTRRKHGLPPQPFAFFQRIYEHVLSHNLGFVLVARFENIPVAGAVFFHFGRKAIYKFGASDPRFVQLRGNNMIMWEAVRWYAQNGYTELNLGRTEMGNDGLRRFKQNWASTEEVLDYWRFDFARNEFVTIPDKVNGWHNQLFRIMPLAASRWAGALLYRHIA